MKRYLSAFLAVLFFGVSVYGAVYNVGPGQTFASIGAAPWATLQPGDIVQIHWRSQPYAEKWVIGRSGTAALPITVRGVPGPAGELPVIDGRNAVTPQSLSFWSENRGVIKIGGSSTPASTFANFIVIENLEIRSGHPSYTFSNDTGGTETYSTSASSIFVERGENITVRNCRIHDSANGFFVASGEDAVSRNILVEGNYIYGNGVDGSILQHNNYTAAVNITFQYNRFGPLRSGSGGVNLKDRSAGLVVRYNWIEGGNRTIDMVDGEDSAIIRNATEYRQTFVYGNVLIKEPGGNNQTIHYGGDSGAVQNYRKGKLHFYNNTIYSTRPGTTVVMRLSTNDEQCDARNNIFFNTAAGTNLAILAESGTLTMANNWAKTGWRNSHEGAFNGSVTGGPSTVTGTTPGFVDAANQDFRPLATSPAINAGTSLHPDVLPVHNVVRHYLRHQGNQARPVSGALELGAFELASDVVMATPTLPAALRFRYYTAQLQASGGSGSYSWSVSAGSLPPGMKLNPSTGLIYGRPRLKGTWICEITVRDAQNTASAFTSTVSIPVRLHVPQ